MRPDPPPLPVAGTFARGAGTLILDFDRPLLPGPVDPLSWQVADNGFSHNTLGMTAGAPGPHQVTGVFAPQFPGIAGTFCVYLPPPFDVKSLTGVPAAAIPRFDLVPLP